MIMAVAVPLANLYGMEGFGMELAIAGHGSREIDWC
jgi:hypothetical protein